MTSAQFHASTGSKKIISGEFSVLSLLEDNIAGFDEALEIALVKVIEEEKAALAERMGGHPDWAPLADKADVAITTDGVEYVVPDDIAADLEYGNPQKKIVASGLLRSTAKRRSFDLASRLAGHISKGLPNA